MNFITDTVVDEKAADITSILSITPETCAAYTTSSNINESVSSILGTDHDNNIYKYNPDIIPESTTVFEAKPTDVANHATYDSISVKNIVKRYNNVKVTRTFDELNRIFYHFDDHGFKTMIVIIFTTPAGKLVCINDTVMPLDNLLKINHITLKNKNEPTVAKISLREVAYDYSNSEYGTVICKNKFGNTFAIENTNVKNMMMVISILSAEKDIQSPKSAAKRSA
jgi:hypothetical protein